MEMRINKDDKKHSKITWKALSSDELWTEENYVARSLCFLFHIHASQQNHSAKARILDILTLMLIAKTLDGAAEEAARTRRR